MGRQAYITRLTLGRSAYDPPEGPITGNLEETRPEPAEHEIAEQARFASFNSEHTNYVQQYDSNGYPVNPSSRSFARRSRRAQNDVLSTVGVCVGIDETGQPIPAMSQNSMTLSMERTKVKTVIRENEIGLFLAAADLGLLYVANNSIFALRNRLQTFGFYSGIPVTRILKTEWKYCGPLQFMFAGLIGSLTWHALDIARHWAIKTLYNAFIRHVSWRIESRKSRHDIQRALDWLEEILKVTSFALIAPLEIFAILQRLHLVPAWPPLPNHMSFVPFSVSSPFQIPLSPQGLGLRSSARFLNSLILSPLPLLYGVFYSRQWLDRKLYGYMRLVLPKPDNPDTYSIRGAMEDELDNDIIPGLGSMKDYNEFRNRESTSIIGEIQKDVKIMVDKIRATCNRWTIWARGQTYGNSDEETGTENIDVVTSVNSNPPLGLTMNVDAIEAGPGAPTEAISSSLDIGSPHDPGLGLLLPNEVHDLSTTTVPLSRQASLDSLSATLLSSSEEDLSHHEANNPTVQITTRTGSTDTIHMSVEIAGPSTNQPLYTNSFSASPHPTPRESMFSQEGDNEKRHRVTALSAHMADALSSHISTHMADFLFIPFEALLVRSIALGFLAAGSRSPSAASLRRDVFPLGGWFEMGTKGWSDYSGKMVLCAGMEVTVGLGVWQIGASVAWWIGRRWFAWGTL